MNGASGPRGAMADDPPTGFETELTELLNRHSIENESNTPDFVLALFVRNCLDAWNEAVVGRDSWYGLKPLKP
jgi:hypothetical protein